MRRLYFLPALCLTVFLAGCFSVKINTYDPLISGFFTVRIHADDPFFTVGHTYRTGEECFLLFWPPHSVLQAPDDYDPEGTLCPVSDIRYTPHAEERIAELREKKTLVFKDCNPYNGRAVYVPTGTEFRVERIYNLFPNCLENNTLRRDITLSGEFEKYGPACFVTRIRATDITPDNDGAKRLK